MALPKTTEAPVIGKQLLRSGTSVGVHYAESQRQETDALIAIFVTIVCKVKHKAA